LGEENSSFHENFEIFWGIWLNLIPIEICTHGMLKIDMLYEHYHRVKSTVEKGTITAYGVRNAGEHWV
jgi:serine-type D-Ala-D-Ala carboxypeptidase/endopeptidase (penicillin-binding protein 4)